ncbi:hypothetical protein [Serratia rhizosphaerae]
MERRTRPYFAAGRNMADLSPLVYQYYVVPTGITDKAFLKGVNDEYLSFLSTSDRDAKVEIEGGAIRLSVRGSVYKFHNGASYATTIYLNAAPY